MVTPFHELKVQLTKTRISKIFYYCLLFLLLLFFLLLLTANVWFLVELIAIFSHCRILWRSVSSSYSTNQNVVLKWLGLHNCAKFTNLCWWKDLFLRIEESSRFRPLKFNKSKNCYVIVWNSLYIKLMYTLIYLSWKKKDFVFTNSYIKVQKVLIWKYLKVITFNLFISFCCMSPSHPFLPSHLVARVLDAKLREPVFKSIWWLLCWISLSFFRGQWNEYQEFLEDDD